jgi:hypothetical protein
MGEAAASTEASLQELRATTETSIHELRASLNLLHGNVARIDTTQQQLLEQMGLVSAAVESSGKANEAVARQLAALENQIFNSNHSVDRDKGRSPSPEEDDADPAARAHIGKATLRAAHVTWTGNTAGASSASAASGDRLGLGNQGGDGILGGGRSGGAGGGGSGGG